MHEMQSPLPPLTIREFPFDDGPQECVHAMALWDRSKAGPAVSLFYNEWLASLGRIDGWREGVTWLERADGAWIRLPFVLPVMELGGVPSYTIMETLAALCSKALPDPAPGAPAILLQCGHSGGFHIDLDVLGDALGLRRVGRRQWLGFRAHQFGFEEGQDYTDYTDDTGGTTGRVLVSLPMAYVCCACERHKRRGLRVLRLLALHADTYATMGADHFARVFGQASGQASGQACVQASVQACAGDRQADAGEAA